MPKSNPIKKSKKNRITKNELLHLMLHSRSLFPRTNGKRLDAFQRKEIILGLCFAIQQYLLHEQDVQLPFLGILKKAKTSKRVIVHPKTKERIDMKHNFTAKFSPSKELKALLQEPVPNKNIEELEYLKEWL